MPSSRIWPFCRFLAVEQQLSHVDRLVELADVRVDPDLAEQRLHAEGARLVGHDRHDVAARCSLSRSSFDSIRTNTIVVEASRSPVPLSWNSKSSTARARAAASACAAPRAAAKPPSALAALAQVRHLRRCPRAGGRTALRRPRSSEIGMPKRSRNARSSCFVHLLLLVGDVLAFARLAQAVALDGPGEDDRRLALVLDGRLVGGVDLDRIVAAEVQRLRLLVGQVLDHLQQLADRCPKKCSRT